MHGALAVGVDLRAPRLHIQVGHVLIVHQPGTVDWRRQSGDQIRSKPKKEVVPPKKEVVKPNSCLTGGGTQVIKCGADLVAGGKLQLQSNQT